jgi:hypothetical protein
MAQDGARCTEESPGCAGEICMADSRGMDLDQDFIWLYGIEIDLGELEGAVETGGG